jgi:hypothetical protein
MSHATDSSTFVVLPGSSADCIPWNLLAAGQGKARADNAAEECA